MIPDPQQYCATCIRKAGITENIISYQRRVLQIKGTFERRVPYIHIILHDLRSMIIWDVSEWAEIEDEVKEQLSVHLQNAGAWNGYLLLSSSCLEILNRPCGRQTWCAGEWHRSPVREGEILCESSLMQENLEAYLDALHKTLERVFFQSYGEHEHAVREQSILPCMLETFFIKCFENLGIDYSKISHEALIHHLITFATTFPSYEKTESKHVSDNNIQTLMIKEACLVPVPAVLHLHCIDPLMMVRAYTRLLSRVKRIKRRICEQDEDSPSHSLLSSSPVFTYVAECLQKCHPRPALIDPYSGNGELLFLLLRGYGREGRSPHDRLIQIADTVFCADPSFFNIFLIRFGLVLYMIDGDFLHPDLFIPGGCDMLDHIRSHIAVGSTLFSHEIEREYLSEQEAQHAMHLLRPAWHEWFCGLPKGQALIITAPPPDRIRQEPPIHQYLSTHFASYSHDATISLYIAEYAINSTTYDSWVFIPASWLSARYALSFRRMVKKERITDIILEERRDKRKDPDAWSCLCAGTRAPCISIIKTADGTTATTHILCRDDLPDCDGWRLDDPFLKEIMSVVERSSVTLKEYCLHAVYRPHDLGEWDGDGVWISIRILHTALLVTADAKPDLNADLIIRGPDEYLVGLLSSPLLRWYCSTLVQTSSVTSPYHLIAALPIHQPDWFSKQEHELVSQITKAVQSRYFLMQKRAYARSSHDKKRIDCKLAHIDYDLHAAVCSLYQIPHALRSRFIHEEGNDSSSLE